MLNPDRICCGPLRRVAAVVTTALLFAAPSTAGDAPGVTDLSMAPPTAIEASDITAALAVSRGTRIEASAPPTVRLPIYFEFNSTSLRPDAQVLLEKVSAALASSELESFQFSIEGHTDAVGSEGYNLSLSSQRAAAVKEFLVARGVSPDKLATVGHGERMPVADNDSEEGRKRNRRVELINLGSP